MLNLKSAEVKRYNSAAGVHRDAAQTLIELCPEKSSSTRAHEAVYLCGYVVECGLKALLLSRTPVRKHPQMLKEMKEELGHNLEKIRIRLAQVGVEFPTDLSTDFKLLRGRWASEMRYDVRRWRKDDAERLVLAASAILDWVRGE